MDEKGIDVYLNSSVCDAAVDGDEIFFGYYFNSKRAEKC